MIHTGSTPAAVARFLVIAAILIAALPVGALAAPDEADFPVPDDLAPRVGFWTDVFTCYGTREVILHDQDAPWRILRVVDLPDDLMPRSRAARRWIRELERETETRFAELAVALESDHPPALAPDEERFLLDAAREVPSRARMAEEARRLGTALRTQQGLREVFARSHRRSGLHLDRVTRILAEEGLPLELAHLPHLESGFVLEAGSRAGARGLWQFTYGTGRDYLRIDDILDERMDPEAATRAAARYLREAYDELGTWPLALTAYCYGRNGMRRAVAKHGHDISCVLEHHDGRAMGFATRNYYASFMAVLATMEQADVHFADVTPFPTWTYDETRLEAYVDAVKLARSLTVAPDTLRALNPSFSKRVWEGERYLPPGTRIRVPAGTLDPVDPDAILAVLEPGVLHSEQRVPTFHRIRRGETLSTIAALYDTTVSKLSALNRLVDPHRIRAGQVLELPRR